jgi:hypothetical protein
VRAHRLLVFGAIVAIALGACSGMPGGAGQQGAAASQHRAAASVAPASAVPTTLPFPNVVMPAELRGVWAARIQGANGPAEGIWRLRVTEHLMELKNPHDATDDGYFWLWTDRIDGTSFHMASDADCQPATYTWALTGTQLTLTTADDACGDRKIVLTTPWHRDS